MMRQVVLVCCLGFFIPSITGRILDDGEFLTDRFVSVEKDVHYLLWTRRNPLTPVELILDDISGLVNSTYDPTKPTRLFAHGFTMNGRDNAVVLALRDEYLLYDDCNFISVDWENLAAGPNYFSAADHANPVGTRTAHLVDFLLNSDNRSSVDRFHLIGFSLGAHVVGRAGADLTAGRIPRITGLDPAYPQFSVEDTAHRLDANDAVFVDVIHTNSGTLTQGALSFPTSIGHVDFFVNGGNAQPGCEDGHSDQQQKANLVDLVNGCSHGRAPAYFTESINTPTGFRSTKCQSWSGFVAGLCDANALFDTLMGQHVSLRARAQYYLHTNSSAPFALG